MNIAQPTGTQFLDFSSTVANETCRYLESGGITADRLQKLISDKNVVKSIARKNAHDLLQLVPDEIVQAKELLTKFYQEVFNLKINLSKYVFPCVDGMPVYCFNSRKLNTDQLLKAIVSKWGINSYSYMSPIAENIDRSSAQARPRVAYVFCHTGEEEPDAKHLGKSYDDAIAEKLIFANPEEYLLMQAYHRYTTGHFMDLKGWTRTSSLWSGGSLVLGFCNSDESRLRLGYGNRGLRDSDSGPREISL